MAAALFSSLLQVAGGFVLGFVIRDAVARKASRPAAKAKSGGKKAARASAPAAVPRPREELKMVLCVNQSLKMGTGKVGAQCAHAAVGVLQYHFNSHQIAIRQWEMHGQPKIALKVQDEAEMAKLEATARSASIPTYIVHDAGRTQIAAGSQTVLAIGPAPKSQLDGITGHLKLL